MTLQPAQPAPQFKKLALLPDGTFGDVSLSDYKGKYVVLFFYPKDFTFVCPTEIIAFSEAVEEFKKRNAVILGVSTDNEYSHYAWTNLDRKQGGLGKINYPLLADTNHSLSKDYGVLNEEGIAFRGLFIIDGSQVLRQITVNDLPVGRNVDEVLRLIDAFQFVEKHGEVCPAGWTKDVGTSGSMKPDPKGSLEYFSKANK